MIKSAKLKGRVPVDGCDKDLSFSVNIGYKK